MSTINGNLRILGMSSGLDTDSIVKGMLTSYQSKLDRQVQTTTKLEWKATAYREVNTLIKNFRSKYLSALSESNMMTNSVYNYFKVDMVTQSDAVSVSASSSASACTMTIDSISQLAEAAAVASTGVFTGESYSSNTRLADLELVNAFQFDGGELSFSINGEVFTFNEDTTIGEMISEVNSSDAGVRIRYSSLTKGFSIESTSTGSGSELDIVNMTGNAFAASASALGIAEGVTNGQDAICSIEGIEVTQSSNTFSFDGITYTLKDESADPITFTVSRDIDSTVEKIKTFIEAYNELVDDLQDRIDEQVFREYDPLTETQKDEMEDNEIELWEEKAKSGLLQRDSYISTLLTTLRSAFYTEVGDTGMSLQSIGLRTGIYSDGAKITIDEEALSSYLAEDPENIQSLFLDDSEDFEGSGLITRISDTLLSYTKQTTNVALNNLGIMTADSEDRETELELRLADKEEALWAKFSAMETALSRLNSMSSWLSTMFTSSLDS